MTLPSLYSRRARGLLSLAALAALLLSTQPAAAQGATAGEAFERGVAFFRDGDFEAAMVEFKQAHSLDPNFRVLYNLGQTSRELRNYAAALDALERYLAEGGQQIDAERRRSVQGWVAELKGKVGTLELSINIADAEVSVDDMLVGRTPLPKPVTVNAGRHKVSVMKGGYAPLTRTVDVAGTEQKQLELSLVPLTADSGTPGAGSGSLPPSTPAPSEPSPWPWGVFAVTIASGVTTGVLGGLAISKKSDFDDALGMFPTNAATIDEARDDARTFAVAADVMGGITLAAAAVTIIGFAVEYGGSGDSSEETAQLRASFGPGYLGLHGTF